MKTRPRGNAVWSAGLMALFLTVSLPALADQTPDHLGSTEESQALREEAERRVRTYRAVMLARHLDLDEKSALALNATMSSYDEARREIQGNLAENMRLLRAAARETEPDEQEVKAAIERVLEARSRLEALRQQEARELLEGLSPARQARLMIFFREFPREVGRLMHEPRPRGPNDDRPKDGPPAHRRKAVPPH